VAKSGARGLLINAALAIGTILICFVAGEALIRVLPLAERLGWTDTRPVATRLADAPPKVAGVLRILALGDSFTEWRDAAGLSFIRVAAREIEASGARVEVVNLAEAGTGIPEYRANFARAADRLAPDLVVIGLYLGNDLRVAGPAAPEPPPPPAWRRLVKKSILLSTTFRLAKVYIPTLRSGSLDALLIDLARQEGRDRIYVAARLAAADPKLVEAARADTINVWDLATAVFFPDYYGELAEAADGTGQGREVSGGIAALDALIADCRARNISPIVVLLPPPVWAEERTRDYFQRLGYRALGPVIGPVPVIERLKRHLGEQSIAVLDPLPALRAARERVYLENDEHLNGRGQAVVGGELARLIATLRR